MRERMAYLILIGMLLILVTFVFAVVGKGEYQPPTPEEQEEQGSVSHDGLLQERSVSQRGPVVNTTAATWKDRGMTVSLVSVAGGQIERGIRNRRFG